MGPVPLLILHHNDTLRQSLLTLLNNNGFAVYAPSEDEDVDALLRDGTYRVVIVDPKHAATGGEQILQQWRRDGVTAHIIVVSDDPSVDAKVRCFDLGADDYLATPFEDVELLARLRVFVRRTVSESTNTEPVLRTHDLVIDVAAGRVTRAGVPIELTPREFSLLRLLAMRKGRIVSRTKIWESLYDHNSFRSSNVMDVYIRRLRVKIDKDFEPPLIVTRFGQGYMLLDDPE